MNFKEVQDTVALWLNRDDLSTAISTFINNTISSIERKFNFQYMERLVSMTASTHELVAPSDYKSLRYSFIVDSYGERILLTKKDAKAAIALYPNFEQHIGLPKCISTIDGGRTFLLRPTPDVDYTIEFAYYAKSSPLINDTDTNWLTDNAPDVLLYGALLNAEPFLATTDLIPVWQSRFDSELSSIGLSDVRENHLGSYQVVQPGIGDVV